MPEPAELRGGVLAFLAERSFVVITARDRVGQLWTSPLTGPPEFLTAASSTTLTASAAPPHGDPLYRLRPGQSVGMIVI